MRRRRILVGSLFAASLVLAGACGPNWDALDPSLGEGGQVICPSDGNDCTADECSSAIPTHTPVPQGTPCNTGGGSVCNATGTCVQCNVAEDCGPGDECKTPTCSGIGTCGFDFKPSGTLAAMQTDGDCQENVCDGMGGVTIQTYAEDKPDDLTVCTVDLCVSGQPVNSPVPAGSKSCSEGGGQVCNGKGACVECNVAADCGITSDCATFTCNDNKCPDDPNKKPGEMCGAGTGRCNGTGECVACQEPSALLFTSNVPVPILHNGSGMSVLEVVGAGTSIIDVDVNVNVANDASGDLILTLISAKGTMIDLSSNNGGANGGNFAGTMFDDDSTGGRVTEVTFVNGMPVVSAIPERNLSLLNGEDPNGIWTLAVKDTGNQSTLAPTIKSWSVTVTSQNGNVTLAPPPFPSPNGVSVPANTTTTSTLVVSDTPGFISKATVSMNLEHKDTSQLVLTLVSPSNKVVPLSTKNGGAGSFMSTIFDDAAQSLMGCTGQGCVTFNSPVVAAIPEGSLSALIGDDPNGTWMLKILDTANGGQPGMLNAWTLNLSTALCPLKP